ncbi:MAG: YceI family protein, partial [Elusimicrobiota bacterium]
QGDDRVWSAQASIEVASIDTDVVNRDKHLLSADFFDAERCPKIEFKSVKVSEIRANRAKLEGDLTMHCVTKPVALELEISDEMKDAQGDIRRAATATATINRKDFGMEYNKTLDAGGLVLGDDVMVVINIEGIAAGSAPKAASEKKAGKAPKKK